MLSDYIHCKYGTYAKCTALAYKLGLLKKQDKKLSYALIPASLRLYALLTGSRS